MLNQYGMGQFSFDLEEKRRTSNQTSLHARITRVYHPGGTGGEKGNTIFILLHFVLCFTI